MRRTGFTLSEILIALSLLGVVAAFTIPKILSSTGDRQLRALATETLASLTQILEEGQYTKQLQITNFNQYFAQRLNAIKVCDTNSSTQGCWDTTVQGNGDLVPGPHEVNEAGFIMPNGVAIVGLNSSPNPSSNDFLDGTYSPNGFIIDLNGTQGPNAFGVDQFLMAMCYETAKCSYYKNGPIMQPGDILPPPASWCTINTCQPGVATSAAAWNSYLTQ